MIDEMVPMDTASFYDQIAPTYDLMAGTEQRFVRERPFYRLIVERYKITTALDAGCGTGFHSLLLSQLGVKVTAVDVSEEMLNIVREQAIKMNIKLSTLESDLLSLPEKNNKVFDAVFCLGNTLPHILTSNDLHTVLLNFSKSLKPNGVLIVQLLNFDRIMRNKKEIQNIKESGRSTFIRSYKYIGDRVFFNIEVQQPQSTKRPERYTTELRPICKAELIEALTNAGFENPKTLGGINLTPFDILNSKDLIIHTRKTIDG